MRKLLLSLLFVSLIVSSILLYGEDELQILPEGIPITGKLVEGPTILSNGNVKVVYQSNQFFPTESNSLSVLNGVSTDMEYHSELAGLLGTYQSDNLTSWVNCPREYTLTIFPGFLPDEARYSVPQWTDLIVAYRATHPNVSVVSQNENIFRMNADGSLSPVAYMQTFPTPSQCDPGSWKNGFIIKYEGVFSGDLSQFTFPVEVIHYLYRVQN